MAERRPVRRLVQQSPHHDARMVSVAADQFRHAAIEPFGHLGRGVERLRGVRLLVDHQADLVAQVELHRRRPAPNEAHGVEAHDLQIEQIAPQEIGIVRKLLPDRIMVARVAAAQEDAPAIETEIAVGESENRGNRSASTARRTNSSRSTSTRAVTRYRYGSLNCQRCGLSIVRSASIDETPGGNSRSRRRATVVSPLRAEETAMFKHPFWVFRRRVVHDGLHVKVAGRLPRPWHGIEIVDVQRRHAKQFHRLA